MCCHVTDEFRDSERDFLLPEKANRSSRERSINGRKSDERGTSRDHSYRTTSQASSRRDDIPEIAVELAERKSGSSRPPSQMERLQLQETEFMTPAHSITEENEEVYEQVDEHGSSSNSHQSSRDRKEKAIQQTARQLLKPITKPKSRSASGLPVTQQLLSRRPLQQRAPRFRISMSPPRKKGDATGERSTN
ncbi:hypothetical protein ANCDUO_11086 [Ancylostoma duodenale]|uniref:Uncharacterized protein n=1 Tax=Ancylostoma duodenale TaxID=51022 RepID=A0A0C2GII7_9BILA|nr:hypothetical protein ANCDUO_11086 [Ancylostoma duodenale]